MIIFKLLEVKTIEEIGSYFQINKELYIFEIYEDNNKMGDLEISICSTKNINKVLIIDWIFIDKKFTRNGILKKDIKDFIFNFYKENSLNAILLEPISLLKHSPTKENLKYIYSKIFKVKFFDNYTYGLYLCKDVSIKEIEFFNKNFQI